VCPLPAAAAGDHSIIEEADMQSNSTVSAPEASPQTSVGHRPAAGMNNLRSILVGVDFSPASATALKQGIRVARWNGARLYVVHIVDTVVVADLAAVLSPMQQRIQESLIRDARNAWEEFRREIPEASGMELTFEVEIDNRVAAMLRLVQMHTADLLVLGTHGNGEPDRGTGPLATACARQAPCDVLLVRDPHTGPFKLVVACVDFSEISRCALVEARRVAARDGAELHVLHVFRPPWRLLPFRSSVVNVPADVQQRHWDDVRRRLEEFAGPPRHEVNDAVKVSYVMFEHGNHGRGVYEYARSAGADLVVLGTQGRSNLRYVLIGSTAERVVRHTPCSVLAVKPDAWGGPPSATAT
jgi:nucleotide-binding universal stress UspA family protein